MKWEPEKVIEVVVKIVKARKNYFCASCLKEIKKGEQYESAYRYTDCSRILPHKRCLECSKLEVENQ